MMSAAARKVKRARQLRAILDRAPTSAASANRRAEESHDSWCPEPESNRYAYAARDFKKAAGRFPNSLSFLDSLA